MKNGLRFEKNHFLKIVTAATVHTREFKQIKWFTVNKDINYVAF